MDKKHALSECYPMPAIELEGYGAFFDKLMDAVRSSEVDEPLAEAIKAMACGTVAQIDPAKLPYSRETYLRNYMGRDEASGWEAILMSWSGGNRTSIHSHPQFASYTFGSGRFLVEVFEPGREGAAVKVAEFEAEAGQDFHSIGEPGRMDNHIHRITCLSDKGFSLHVYSGDALEGLTYREG